MPYMACSTSAFEFWKKRTLINPFAAIEDKNEWNLDLDQYIKKIFVECAKELWVSLTFKHI